ncbi:MAG: DNA helicase II [Pseudomonadales bacterium]|nr:DNA helicase II [Pseudomonadales bacterium]
MQVTPSLLEGLNPDQRHAVTSDAPQLLVLAGAGSGKTRVLTHRIVWFCQEFQLSPQSFLAVTFTNKAAAEMRQRLEVLLGARAQGLWVGTFHGLAHRLLRRHAQEASLPATFQILDADDQTRLIKRLAREQGLDENAWPARQMVYFINHEKEEGRRARPSDVIHDPYERTMQQVYSQYEEHCQRTGMIDFAEILLRCVELLRHNSPLRAHYQQRFRQVLVDEFQDSNDVQYQWLKLLTGEGCQFTVVGDDDQSIYGWRGARIGHIRNFQQDYPEADVIRLEQNYRSTGTILAAANAVISHNKDRLGKELWTQGEPGEVLKLYTAFNDLDEAHYIAHEMTRLAAKGRTYRHLAVLYRSNAQSRILEEALIRAHIPYHIHGGLRFFDRAEVRNAMAYMRQLANRDDDAAFERIVNVPTRGLGERTLELLREQARLNKLSLWATAGHVLNQGLLPARAAACLMSYRQLIEELAQVVEPLPLHEQLEHVIHHSGLYRYHEQEKGEKGQARIENLRELVGAAREFAWDEADEDAAPSALAAFIDHASLEAGEAAAGEHDDAVQLMTLHAAKGLEFDVVFLAGLEEGLFPHEMSLESNNLEEERRLCYVGMTRARQCLYLTHAEIRRLYGQEKSTIPSRFLREIPQELLQNVRMTQQEVPSTQAGSSGSAMLGQRVRHPRWGEGVILAYEGSGPQARVQVNFADLGAKWLIAQYARLEPC